MSYWHCLTQEENLHFSTKLAPWQSKSPSSPIPRANPPPPGNQDTPPPPSCFISAWGVWNLHDAPIDWNGRYREEAGGLVFHGFGAKALRRPLPTERWFTYREHGGGGGDRQREVVDRGGGFVKWEADENEGGKKGMLYAGVRMHVCVWHLPACVVVALSQCCNISLCHPAAWEKMSCHADCHSSITKDSTLAHTHSLSLSLGYKAKQVFFLFHLNFHVFFFKCQSHFSLCNLLSVSPADDSWEGSIVRKNYLPYSTLNRGCWKHVVSGQQNLCMMSVW